MIVLSNLCKSYGTQRIFSSLHLELPIGETTCFLGESGIGKTTLFRLLLGLEQPDSGTITGVPQPVSAVFQEDRLCETLDAMTNVLLPHLGKGSQPTKAQVREALTALGLPGDSSKALKEYSGGMKRRVAILRGLLAPSALLCLDEPFRGLDSDSRAVTADFLRQHSKGKTLLCITHDPEDLLLLAPSQVLSLKQGEQGVVLEKTALPVEKELITSS